MKYLVSFTTIISYLISDIVVDAMDRRLSFFFLFSIKVEISRVFILIWEPLAFFNWKTDVGDSYTSIYEKTISKLLELKV